MPPRSLAESRPGAGRTLRPAPAAALARTILAAAILCALLPAPADAQTSATITPSLSPDRLGARSVLSFTIHYAAPLGVPAPVRQSVLRFPAGLSLDIPRLSSCTANRLRARGASGCDAESALGRGHALAETQVGPEKTEEDIYLWAFLGPPRNLQPTVEILGQGYTPFDERVVLTGTMVPASGPYGEELVMPIPVIPTLNLEPDASIVTFSLEIGMRARQRGDDANTVVLPASCPRGGFPFAGEFTYADGSSGSAVASAPCPQ